MSLIKKTRHYPNTVSGTDSLVSPGNILFILTVLLFGYCFLYVSLPFMLRKHAARLETSSFRTTLPIQNTALAR